MPFVDSAGEPLDRVPLLYRGAKLFQLAEPIAWIDPRDGARVSVPAHDTSRPATDPENGTDLASVPEFLWGLVASYGRQTLPAILHDSLDDAARRRTDDARERLALRRRADAIFLVALREQGVTDLRSAAMWATVSVERHLRFAPLRGAILVAQLVVAVAACVTGVGLTAGGHPLALLLLLAPAALALPWGRDAGMALTGGYLAALYSPLVVAAALASAVEYLVALLVWIARGRRGATPHPGPTARDGDPDPTP